MLRAYGGQLNVKDQVVLLIEASGFQTSGNYANGKDTSYFIENDVLVKLDRQSDA